MKIYLLGILITLMSFLSLAQEEKVIDNKIDIGNCREGEDVEYCLSHKKMKELREKNPQLFEKSNFEDQNFKEILHQVKTGQIEKGIVYTIPVVFHIIHDDGVENISREQVLDALEILNKDFRKLNDDVNYIVSDFVDVAADSEIQFSLATKAPNGKCFDGITRTKNSITFDGSSGSAQIDAIVSGNNVYRGNWSGDKYLNIYVLADVGGAAGYTYRPYGNYGASMDAGIFIKNGYVGSIGTSSVVTSRALTHEVGHWLGLAHTWGLDNNPGIASSCNQDDDVEDTPLTIGVKSCQKGYNSCDDTNPSTGVLSSWSYDVVDNVENFMDYSYCSKMFTKGQADLMRAVLNSDISRRNNLWTPSNLSSTGAGSFSTLCSVDFSVENTVFCANQSIDFIDQSFNDIVSWDWTFQGATPNKSTLQNPSVVYDKAGSYSVTLKVISSNGSSLTKTKSNYVTILDPASELPLYEGFEAVSDLVQNNEWKVNNVSSNIGFVINDNVSYSGSKSVGLNNFSQAPKAINELISSSFDLSGLAQSDIVTLSFRYAYRKKTPQNFETLRIYVSTDCGNTWTNRQTISGSTLSSLSTTDDWKPSSINDWVTYHVTSIKSQFFVENLMVKFSFESDGGNNLYLDDINLYKGSPSSDFVLDLNESKELRSLTLYPNPSEGKVNVSFSSQFYDEAKLIVYDVFGKELMFQNIHINSGENSVLLNLSNLSNGMYIISIETGSEKKITSFLKK